MPEIKEREKQGEIILANCGWGEKNTKIFYNLKWRDNSAKGENINACNKKLL